jgi:hypothetical protein
MIVFTRILSYIVYVNLFSKMNTKTMFVIANVAAIGILGMAAVTIPSVPQAHAPVKAGSGNDNNQGSDNTGGNSGAS